MGIQLFTQITDTNIVQREQFAYKVVIEPFEYDGNFDTSLDNNEQLTEMARSRLKQIDRGYFDLYGQHLILSNNSKIDWDEASIVADMESEESLAFSYNTSWGDSAISDLISSFIPSNVTGSIASKILTKGGTVAAGKMAYEGSFIAANFNNKKVMAKPSALTYNLTIKVIDKDGSGAVLKTLTKLLAYTVPITQNPQVSFKDLGEGLSSTIKAGKDVLVNSNVWKNGPGEVLDVAGSVVGSVGKMGGNTLGDLVDTIKNSGIAKSTVGVVDVGVDAAKESGNDFVDLGADLAKFATGFEPRIEILGAPCPIRIFVSDYFIHSGCVITSVAPNLSKQININGYPVFGTFNITVEAREMSTLDLGASFSEGTHSLQTLRNVMFVTHKTRDKFKPKVMKESGNTATSQVSSTKRNGRSTGGKPV